jgi:hypothetical protein
MREKKWTPGPWVIDARCFLDICPMSMEEVAVSTCSQNYNAQETQANAHLIAAAPDLVEACEHALGQVNAVLNMFPEEMAAMGVNPDSFATTKKLKAALSKAYGETP